MKIHFIAIGGSAMHNLAIALHKKGYTVSGSDDQIFEPSKGKLQKYGLLPENIGWDPDRISEDLDAIILGMHARPDNPELEKAKEKGLKIYSYPQYIYEQSKNKKRVVIGGSHGKTTITSMVMHVLKTLDKNFDYLVGAQLEGFETMVKITDEADVIILEGDEYLSSPIDPRPKFHWYRPHIALVSGIAWDHINVFPTYETYVNQFRIFIKLIEDSGCLIYYDEDDELTQIVKNSSNIIKKTPYHTPEHRIEEGKSFVIHDGKEISVNVFGDHNLQNLNGARLICKELGIEAEDFYKAITTFKGASRRMELIARNGTTKIYKDFAHSPSKLRATVKAMRKQYPDKKIIACIELHTFSSLNDSFIDLYENTMKDADESYIYYNPKTIEHKKLAPLKPEQVEDAFGEGNIEIHTNSHELMNKLTHKEYENSILVFMTSGNFDGVDLNAFASQLIGKGE